MVLNAPLSLWRLVAREGLCPPHQGNWRWGRLRHRRPTDVQNFELTGCTKAEDANSYRCDTRGQAVLNIEGRRVPIPASINPRGARESGTLRAYAKLRPYPIR